MKKMFLKIMDLPGMGVVLALIFSYEIVVFGLFFMDAIMDGKYPSFESLHSFALAIPPFGIGFLIAAIIHHVHVLPW